MNKRSFAFLLFFVPTLVFAAGGGAHLDHADIDLGDRDALQRGARLFVNYCLSCHSASYMRYSRLARDLELTEDQVEENLMFTADKIGSEMQVAMPGEDAANWFGAPPPDLSVSSRSRGVDWLYTYLRSFYLDANPSRPFGVNNLLFKDVAMPHVLWELQGWQKPVYRNVADPQGGEDHQVIDSLDVVVPGTMTEKEYDRAIRDLVTYMAYMGEPAKLVRIGLGIKVLVFLGVFFVVAYMLKKEYWKDIH